MHKQVGELADEQATHIKPHLHPFTDQVPGRLGMPGAAVLSECQCRLRAGPGVLGAAVMVSSFGVSAPHRVDGA